MTVLKFSVPARDRLQCEAPGCNELATIQVKMGRGTVTPEIFCCKAHVSALTCGYVVRRIVKLDTPGERNPEAPEGIPSK